MVEQVFSLDTVFASLADPTRRDIIQRLLYGELSVSEIASVYDMSLAAVSKHLKILERACLVMKRRQGKQYIVTVSPGAIQAAESYLRSCETLWNERFDHLDKLFKEDI